ncbi:hypothetical protein [uncultured Tateyamaria sp.]|uniref:hypothetical protein n=1 Tax=uncultured Tateyamaria sp. TaxID=455651 RepID=UPI00260E78D3|nr:hypothetical protein [uncultured Tateyamaria sp.]
MSAPDTNIEKQTRRHSPALLGIGTVVVAILAFILLAPLAPDDDATPPPVAATETN